MRGKKLFYRWLNIIEGNSQIENIPNVIVGELNNIARNSCREFIAKWFLPYKVKFF